MRNLTKSALVIGLFCLAILGFWLFFKTNYRLSHYILNNCKENFLTVIDYNNNSERGIALVAGKYEKQELPKSGYMVNTDMSGFDSFLTAFIFCNETGIYVVSSTNSFEKIGDGGKINFRRVDIETYKKIRKKHQGALLQIE